ncbi:hypothetical protein EV182_001424 [Spiromyces aspiralis]|uniref:Uncharacterized protein n=1 Tax=Spiromyces aspiralis TaxID=68401 RepID=A0ACC1HT60_9FUNG|nr:hypothetical protein EV182_001424 [Spiromyces aspiralis]
MITEANFWGADSNMVVAASDDKRIYVWDRGTGQVINGLDVGILTVNRVRPHPTELVLITCGISHCIKVVGPNNDNLVNKAQLAYMVRDNKQSMDRHVSSIYFYHGDRMGGPEIDEGNGVPSPMMRLPRWRGSYLVRLIELLLFERYSPLNRGKG